MFFFWYQAFVFFLYYYYSYFCWKKKCLLKLFITKKRHFTNWLSHVSHFFWMLVFSLIFWKYVVVLFYYFCLSITNFGCSWGIMCLLYFHLFQYNATHIIYKSIIRYLPTFTVGGVSNTNTYMVHVQCELPRSATPDKPIRPLTETVTQSAPGEFIVNLHFFR